MNKMVNKLKDVRAKLKNSKGFTLIEMLVVIAIIGILVLLALPSYLGYTKDANVATMQADVRLLESAALVSNLDEKGWPAGIAITGNLPSVVNGQTVNEIDMTKLDNQIQSLKNNVEGYGIITSGKHEGKVIYLAGEKDRDGDTHYGLGDGLVVEAKTVTP